MRLLVNHSVEDRPYLGNLIPLLKEHGLTGVASAKKFDMTQLNDAAIKAKCDAVLLSNQDTLQLLLGTDAKLSNYRGSRIAFKVPIITINPLEHIHTVPYGRFVLNKDLEKFKTIKRQPPQFSYTLLETAADFANAYNILTTQCIIISYDIETNEKKQITCISYTGLTTTGGLVTFVVPFVDFGVDHFVKDHDYAEALSFMRAINTSSIPKMAFNGAYDAQYTIQYGAAPSNFVIDPMILGWSAYSEFPRSLEFNASLYCDGYFYWKDEADASKKKKDIRSYWAYCGKDSWYTLRVFLGQLHALPEYAYTNYRKVFRLVYPSLYAAYEGILIDEDLRKQRRADIENRKLQALNNLRKMAALAAFNPGSPDQVHDFIYATIGAKKPEKVKGKGTDEKTLNRISMQHPLIARICGDILEYRGVSKLLSTYFDFEQLNGRLMYGLDPSGTETARFASKASSWWCGTQIQNIPRGNDVKDWLIADPGYVLIEADKNKSEARCVAYIAQSEPMIIAIEDAVRDFYKVCASLFFNLPYEKVTKELRNEVTKHIIHGTHYVMGPEPFIDRVTPKKMYEIMAMLGTKVLNMKEFANYLLSLYHKTYPALRQTFYPAVKSEIQRTHKMVSPLGWVRYFFGDITNNHAVFRAAVAHGPQNLSVELINEGFYRVYEKLCLPSNGDFRLKAQIHDSIFCQVREGTEMHYVEEMRKLMDFPVIVHGRSMLIPTEFKIGKSWGTMHELKT